MVNEDRERVDTEEVHELSNWISKSSVRPKVLLGLKQPMTARQLSKQTDHTLHNCKCALQEFRTKNLVKCINPVARRSRLYWLTDLGVLAQKRLCGQYGLGDWEYDFPNVPWDVYGWTCFSHRTAILKALKQPMSARKIKRIAYMEDETIRLPYSSVTLILRQFREKGIACLAEAGKKRDVKNELTDLGWKLRLLMTRAEDCSHSQRRKAMFKC